MSRGFGEIEFLQEALPEWLALLVAVVTQLGDVWFVSLVLAALYLSYRREAIATVVGRTLGALGLLWAGKYLFSFPRPADPLAPVETYPGLLQPVYEATAFASGYGFPSGHALVTTVVYLSLVDVASVATRRRRLYAAVALVTVVSLSRVALGVHYLVDVVAGVGFGLAFLAATDRLETRWAGERATVVFGLAVSLSLAAVAASGGAFDTLALLAASLGGLGGWATYRLVETAITLERRAVGHALVAAAAFAALAAGIEEFGPLSVPGGLSLGGFALAAAIALPVATRSGTARRIRGFLGFWATVVAWNVREADPRR